MLQKKILELNLVDLGNTKKMQMEAGDASPDKQADEYQQYTNGGETRPGLMDQFLQPEITNSKEGTSKLQVLGQDLGSAGTEELPS